MKFLVTKEPAGTKLITSLMAGVVFFIILYLGFDVVIHAYVIGADIQSVTLTLVGDSENFIEPVLIDTLLLQVHIDLFVTLFALMILASIFIRFHERASITRWMVHLVFLLGMVTPMLLIVAYLGWIWLVPVWISAFVAWHLLACFMGVMVLKKVVFA